MDDSTSKIERKAAKARRPWWKKKRFLIPGIPAAGFVVMFLFALVSVIIEGPRAEQSASPSHAPATAAPETAEPEAQESPAQEPAAATPETPDSGDSPPADDYEDVTVQVRAAMAEARVGEGHDVYKAVRDEEMVGVKTDMYSLEESGYEELGWSIEACEAVARSSVADGLFVAIFDLDGEVHSYSADMYATNRSCSLYE